MKVRELLVFAVILLISCSAFASAESDVVQKLNLTSKEIAGVRVYYEGCFEPNLGAFEKAYSQFLSEKVKTNAILSRKEQVVADINRLLGIVEPPIEKQYKMLSDLAGGVKIDKPSFYLVKKSTIKGYLRGGGKLAGFKYDAATDMAEYRLEFQSGSKTGPAKAVEITVPISSEGEFEKEIGQFFEMFRVLSNIDPGLMVHEVVEMGIVIRAKPRGPYWRWFTDGFANAVTFEILKRHVDQKDVEQFGQAFDIAEFKDLEKEINLGYWMSGDYCIFLHGGPIDYEKRFSSARYAYATHEAQRLVDKHGLECVKEILDEVSKEEFATSGVLLAAVKKVIGEDMGERLGQYQTFATCEEGMLKYTEPFNAASNEKDYEQMLINLLRIMELQEFQYSANSLECWHNAAWILYKMGHGEKGYEVMQQCIDLFSGSPVPGGRQAAIEQMCLYVLKCRRPDKGLEFAEEMLETTPEHAPALAIVMLTKVRAGELSRAKEIAKQLVDLAKSEKDKRSLSYKAASWVLAIDPNR